MSYQPRVRAASWTTLVLLLVCVPPASALAVPRYSDAVTRDVDPSSTQQNLVAAPSPTPPVGMSRGGEKQSEQGRQYGQPGFVGEPINLNVVNADIPTSSTTSPSSTE